MSHKCPVGAVNVATVICIAIATLKVDFAKFRPYIYLLLAVKGTMTPIYVI